jgi:RNA-splicing ligase RtcB
MSDQPEDQSHPTSQPTPPPTSEPPSNKPPLVDAIRAKMEEYDVDRHLNDLASTLESAVRQGVAKAGELAHEHKGDIDRLLDKAAGAVDRHTDGRHADRISQVRGSLERGVGRIADQRETGAPGEGSGTDVPPSNG